MRRFLIVFTVVLISLQGFGQDGIRIGVHGGYGNYVGASSDRTGLSFPNGRSGMDLNLDFHNYLSPSFFSLAKGGYLIMNPDNSAVNEELTDMLGATNTWIIQNDPHQTLFGLLGVGFCISNAAQSIELEPAVGAGFAWYRTGRESFQAENTAETYYWESENANDVGFMMNAGAGLNFYLSNVIQLNITGNYYLAYFNFDREVNTNLPTYSAEEVKVDFGALSGTLGLSLRL